MRAVEAVLLQEVLDRLEELDDSFLKLHDVTLARYARLLRKDQLSLWKSSMKDKCMPFAVRLVAVSWNFVPAFGMPFSVLRLPFSRTAGNYQETFSAAARLFRLSLALQAFTLFRVESNKPRLRFVFREAFRQSNFSECPQAAADAERFSEAPRADSVRHAWRFTFELNFPCMIASSCCWSAPNRTGY